MKKRSSTSVTIAPHKSEQKSPEIKPSVTKSIRWNESDLELIGALKQKSGVSSTSDVLRHCLRIAAEKYGIKF